MKSFIFSVIVLTSSFVQAKPMLETLLGYLHNYEGLVFQVHSGGCTTKDDFIVVITNKDVQEVRLYRVRPDFCRAHLVHGTLIKFSFDELPIDRHRRFKIVNPIHLTYAENPS